MLFNTWEFALFLAVVLAAYHILAVRGQNVLLLAASYFFYGWWDWRFLSLLLISTVVDYSVGRALGTATGRTRRPLLLVSVLTNLGILGVFKYFDFFVSSVAELLTALGLQPHLPVLNVILPVGISFYTFQTMAYTIDVYRRKMTPVRDPLAFAVYVSFFPQLVAGPIERPQHLIPQFERPRRVVAGSLASGCVLILIGLARKVAIADLVAPEVDAAFATPGDMSAPLLIRATFLFALQIYGDFAGYSDIARGTARLFGFELIENFNHPYFARNITDFWRRWHISLSSWLRDYLYIPLGGNRGPRWFVYRNLLLTMLLGGLWHGAGWNFVIWGAIHGGALAVHKLWLGGKKPEKLPFREPVTWQRVLASWVLTMIVVEVAWVFFRAPTFGHAMLVLQRMATGGGWLDVTPALLVLPGVVTLLALLIDVPQALSRNHTAFLDWSWMLRGAVYAILVLCIVFSVRQESVPFIYFQF